MIYLTYENGVFHSEKPFKNRDVETEDVTLTVKDVVPESQQAELAQWACEFINQGIGINYQTEGIGGHVATETREISIISKFNFRIYKK